MSEVMHDEVVIFAKSPIAGRVKTRLQPELSADESVVVYRAFLNDVLEMVGGWATQAERRRATLAWSGADDGATFRWAEQLGIATVAQGEGDLGARMRRAVEGARARGAGRVVIVGTDSPTLSREHLELAFDVLGRRQVVWGPSFDGGYYLVGVNTEDKPGGGHAERVIFEDVSWSTASVLSESWERASEAGLLSDLLGFWYDVDTFEDVKMLEFHLLEYLERQGFEGARHTREVLLTWRKSGRLTR
ncbi:glycosyltransferase [Lujinxingia vulgaris]|uniref:Glycosyltransferase n=1 Tax=Lujinxingia vulgaris TaxID=2600176 RepID=A0A5C6X7H4_9DELT|nr:TIGR04282 family arsenosugar biosynthesis glycosyltransferase [Lujinxingia vulgaris]TXD37793.1 glycosyltransferase [Lujinxingia vulgaris]